MISSHNSICYLNFLLPCNVINSQFLVICRNYYMDIFGRPLFCLYIRWSNNSFSLDLIFSLRIQTYLDFSNMQVMSFWKYRLLEHWFLILNIYNHLFHCRKGKNILLKRSYVPGHIIADNITILYKTNELMLYIIHTQRRLKDFNVKSQLAHWSIRERIYTGKNQKC